MTAITTSPTTSSRVAMLRIGRLMVAALMLALTIAVLVPAGGNTATASEKSSLIESGRLRAGIYAYVAAGETLDVSFTNKPSVAGPENNLPTQFTVYRPDGSVAKTGHGRSFTATGLSGGGAGVWKIDVGDSWVWMDWSITVRNAKGKELDGRVWVPSYEMRQISSMATPDLKYWAINDAGYEFALTLYSYDGVNSTLAVNAYGWSESGNECTPAYRSMSYTDEVIELPDVTNTSCENYRIFFEKPAHDLPESANSVEGPLLVKPDPLTQQELADSTVTFVHTDAAKKAGTFVTTMTDRYSGRYEIQIDTNNNGRYTDTVDRTLTGTAISGTSEYSVIFDGMDGYGQPINPARPVSARLYFENGSELHLAQADVEGRAGIEVVRTNGPNAPDATVYWDDRRMTSNDLPYEPTPKVNGTMGVDSTGGVHGWDWVRGPDRRPVSWGNNAMIVDWAVVNVEATSKSVLVPSLYRLSFDGADGTVSDSSVIAKVEGDNWGTLPTATRDGYVFTGWATAEAGGTQVSATSAATSDLTAYAQWRPVEYNVNFDANVGTGTVTGGTASATATYNCADCTLTPNGFTKTTGALALIDEAASETAEVNSTFLGWSLSPDSRTGDIADQANAGSLSMTDGDTVTLYAVWDDAPQFIVSEFPNRYFSLDQARSGDITEAELLSTVKATDLETNPLQPKTRAQISSSGSDVGITLHDYAASDYTSMTAPGSVSLTYKVKDEVGNVAFLRIRVSVSDGAAAAPAERTFLRGISPDFANEDPAEGGLSSDSLWRTDPIRSSALTNALNEDTAPQMRYCLDTATIAGLREQIRNAGLGNAQMTSALSAVADTLSAEAMCE